MRMQSGGGGGGGEGQRRVSKPQPRQTKRWIVTPLEGTKMDLGRLENARDPFPLRDRTRKFETGLLSWSASTGALVGSSEGRGAGGARAVASPRIERTVRRLSAMEACLRNLEDSVKELQSGEPSLEQVEISRVRRMRQKSYVYVCSLRLLKCITVVMF